MARTNRKPAPKPAPARETYLDQRDLDAYREAAETGQPARLRVERIYSSRKTARRAAQAHQDELKRIRRKAIAAGAFDPVAARTGRQSAQWKQGDINPEAYEKAISIGVDPATHEATATETEIGKP